MGEKKGNSLGSNSPRALKFPGMPAWKPVRAGREAGLAPEPAGLGAGQGRAGGRACPEPAGLGRSVDRA